MPAGDNRRAMRLLAAAAMAALLPLPARAVVIYDNFNQNTTRPSATFGYGWDFQGKFGYYSGKDKYQIYDGSGADKADSGLPFSDTGISVTVTITGPDTYDLEIQTLKDKKLTKLPGRKLSAAGSIQCSSSTLISSFTTLTGPRLKGVSIR